MITEKMTDLSSLIARLEKAEGPSRDLDVEIMNAVDPRSPDEKRLFAGKAYPATWGAVGQICDQIRYFVEAPFLTSSVDALLGLIHEHLPEWRIATEHGENYSIAQFKRGWGARLQILGVATSERADDEIALCIAAATLRALQQKGSSNG